MIIISSVTKMWIYIPVPYSLFMNDADVQKLWFLVKREGWGI